MYRAAIEKLYRWKASKRRKPLIIEGARQVGKTWLMKEFGSQAYADTIYINFDSNSRMASCMPGKRSILTTRCSCLTRCRKCRGR